MMCKCAPQKILIQDRVYVRDTTRKLQDARLVCMCVQLSHASSLSFICFLRNDACGNNTTYETVHAARNK